MTSIRLLIVFLLLCLLPSPVLAVTETNYVSAFSATIMNWNTHTGTTPYLQAASGNAITAFTDHVVDAIFSFADTACTDFSMVTSVKLKGQCATNNEDHIATCLLYGSSGGAWTSSYNAYDNGDSAFSSFTSADLKATINSLARINECRMNITKHNVGSGTLSLRQMYLEIIYTSATGTNTSLLIGDVVKAWDSSYSMRGLQFYGIETFSVFDGSFTPKELVFISDDILSMSESAFNPLELVFIPDDKVSLSDSAMNPLELVFILPEVLQTDEVLNPSVVAGLVKADYLIPILGGLAIMFLAFSALRKKKGLKTERDKIDVTLL